MNVGQSAIRRQRDLHLVCFQRHLLCRRLPRAAIVLFSVLRDSSRGIGSGIMGTGHDDGHSRDLRLELNQLSRGCGDDESTRVRRTRGVRYGWRVYQLHALRRDHALIFSTEQRNGIAVSSVALVTVDGHLELLWIGQFHRLALVGVEILHIPAAQR